MTPAQNDARHPRARSEAPETTTPSPAPSRWGRSRFGGGSAALIATSLALGAALSAGVGALFLALARPQSPALGFWVMIAATLPILAALAWALLVERSTIAGAVSRPADSIESVWYDRAAAGTFGDLLIGAGVGAAVFSFTGLEAPVGLVLAAVVLLAMASFGVRMLVQKRANR